VIHLINHLYLKELEKQNKNKKKPKKNQRKKIGKEIRKIKK
jgi:hypothetical protein